MLRERGVASSQPFKSGSAETVHISWCARTSQIWVCWEGWITGLDKSCPGAATGFHLCSFPLMNATEEEMPELVLENKRKGLNRFAALLSPARFRLTSVGARAAPRVLKMARMDIWQPRWPAGMFISRAAQDFVQRGLLIPKDLGLPWACEDGGGKSADTCKRHTWMLQMLLHPLPLAGAFFAWWKLCARSCRSVDACRCLGGCQTLFRLLGQPRMLASLWGGLRFCLQARI